MIGQKKTLSSIGPQKDNGWTFLQEIFSLLTQMTKLYNSLGKKCSNTQGLILQVQRIYW